MLKPCTDSLDQGSAQSGFVKVGVLDRSTGGATQGPARPDRLCVRSGMVFREKRSMRWFERRRRGRRKHDRGGKRCGIRERGSTGIGQRIDRRVLANASEFLKLRTSGIRNKDGVTDVPTTTQGTRSLRLSSLLHVHQCNSFKRPSGLTARSVLTKFAVAASASSSSSCMGAFLISSLNCGTELFSDCAL